MAKDFSNILKTKFSYILISQLLSQITIQLMNFLLIIRVFEGTSSAIASSFVWVAYALPALIVGPFAAAWVDSMDKKKILMYSNAFQAITIFIYALTFQKFLFLSYAVVMTYSFFNQFYAPAEAASIPFLVKKERLPKANGLFFLTQHLAVLVGFGMAGAINNFIGYKNSFLMASVLLAIAFLSVTFLPMIKPENDQEAKLEKNLIAFYGRILEGYHFIKKNSDILYTFLLLITIQVTLPVTLVSLPAIANNIIGIKTSMAGTFIVMPLIVGAATGTLIVDKFLKKMRKKYLIEMSLLLMAISLFLIVFFVPALNAERARKITGVIFFALTGLSFISVFISAQTYLQEKTPENLRSRVFGNFWIVATSASIIPVLFSATITEVFGAGAMLFVIAVVMLTASVLSTKKGQEILLKAS